MMKEYLRPCTNSFHFNKPMEHMHLQIIRNYTEAAQIPDEADIAGIKQLKYTFSFVILAVLRIKSTVAEDPEPEQEAEPKLLTAP